MDHGGTQAWAQRNRNHILQTRTQEPLAHRHTNTLTGDVVIPENAFREFPHSHLDTLSRFDRSVTKTVPQQCNCSKLKSLSVLP